eukprot:TRINITY_DN2169_c0_g1_i9.p1 TRINITY_DN2169_c0_g1~~TRINITY_DN2169_c0_g1_i9.p1  ORF type:complete len:426 (-),score=56.01 TRINITY_DN2169_c0_g1_i9:773-2017(-)
MSLAFAIGSNVGFLPAQVEDGRFAGGQNNQPSKKPREVMSKASKDSEQNRFLPCCLGLGGLLALTASQLRRAGRWRKSVGQGFRQKNLGDRLQVRAATVAASSDEIESMQKDNAKSLRQVVRRNIFKTVKKVILWSGSSMVVGYVLYPLLQKIAWFLLTGSASVPVVSDATQGCIANFLALMSLLFSILAGNSYSALYSQNEAIFCALFAEVSEAKALMEQIALICSGRPFYRSALENIRRYVERDLRRLDRPPSVLCAIKPRDDPLESILYLTSVGVPSAVYETVRSLRQRRGDRLGAVQRKLPPVQIGLLYVLGGMNLVSLLLMGPSDIIGAESRLCRALFSLVVGAVMMTMAVILELWTPVGGAYNVDGVLTVMIRGLQDELEQRLKGRTFSDTRLPPPPPSWAGKTTSTD